MNDLVFQVGESEPGGKACIYARKSDQSPDESLKPALYILTDGRVVNGPATTGIEEHLYFWPTKHEAENFLQSWEDKQDEVCR